MPSREELKEIKLPKYVKGTCWASWSEKYLRASRLRGRALDCLKGVALSEARDPNIDEDELDELIQENDRTLDDLINCLPDGRLTECVMRAKSDVFTSGCAATAWEELREEIQDVTNSEKEALREAFESFGQMSISKNPKEAIRELQDKVRELDLMHVSTVDL